MKVSVRLAVITLLTLVVLGGLGIGAYLFIRNQQIEETRSFQTELRDGLVASCERNGNPLREAVQAQLRQEIRQRSGFDYERFFPNVPRAELEVLLEQQNEEDRLTLEEIAPVNCSSLYPKP